MIGPWFLNTFGAATGLDGLHYALLLPPEQVCVESVRSRSGHAFTDLDAARHMYREFANAAVADRHVIRSDTSADALASSITEMVLQGYPTGADLVQALPDALEGHLADVVVCMGDTVLHLGGRDAVIELCDRAAQALAPGGSFVLTYRDLTEALHDLERFMPVRSDDEAIMLCVLDYDEPETVTVNDLIYIRGAEGWQLAKSSYPKLRLAPDWVCDRLTCAGLDVGHHSAGAGGVWTTVATPPR